MKLNEAKEMLALGIVMGGAAVLLWQGWKLRNVTPNTAPALPSAAVAALAPSALDGAADLMLVL